MIKNDRILHRIVCLMALLGVVILGFGVRYRAVQQLPIDYDEDDYFGAGQHYIDAIKNGDWAEVINYNYNYEHPPLTKLIYGFAIASQPEVPQVPELPSTASPANSLPMPHFLVDRMVSAVFGTLEVLALAVINPLAGLFLAVNTWQIKYTSQIMLEPLPALTSLLAVLFYVKSRRKWNGWLAVSAAALGITAASKYTYCLSGVAIAIHWLVETRPHTLRKLSAWRKWLLPLIAWGFLAIPIFFVFDPHLWSDPFVRLKGSLLFHGAYAQSDHVREAGYPLWQPLVWLASSVPWNRDVFLISLDIWFSLLAVLGFRRLWEKQRVYALWLIIALGFLLAWPTKWPQYILILTAPLSLASAEGFKVGIWEPLTRLITQVKDRVNLLKTRAATIRLPSRLLLHPSNDTRRALPWLLPGLIAIILITLYPMIYQVGMSLTDFNALSIRDGLTGGVWREVWRGLTMQENVLPVGLTTGPFGGIRIEARDRGEPVVVNGASFQYSTKQVHFVGTALWGELLSGGVGGLLVFNVLWTIMSVALQTSLGLGLALLLNRRGVRLKGFWNMLFILPWAIPEFIGALMWYHLFEPTNGWIALAFHTKLTWTQDPSQAFGVLLIAVTWLGFPFMLVAATAGLKMVSVEVYDAAAVDGANSWQQFRLITWPLLLPLLAPAILIRSIFAFNQFYLFYVMNPPLINFATLSFFTFNTNTGSGGQFAISAAINLFTVLVLIVLILWMNRWSKASQGVTYV